MECRISIDQFFAKDGKVVFGKTGSKTEVGIRTFYFPGKTPPNRLVRAAGQTIGCNVDGGGKINAVEKSLQKCAETCLAKGGTFPCGTLLNQLDSFATADVEDGIIYNFYLSKGVNLRILSDITIDTLICSESLADYSD